MQVKFDYSNAVGGIKESLQVMQEKLGYGRDQCLKTIGLTVKANVENNLPRSDKVKKKRIPHMKDDVQYMLKTSRGGERYVSIRGGKKTASLWHVVNDGHVAEDGTVVSGKHFIETAVAQSEKEIDAIIDSFLEGVLDG